MNGVMAALVGILALVPGLPQIPMVPEPPPVEIPTVPEPPPIDVDRPPVPRQTRAEAYEADFIARINSLRASAGVPVLALDSNLMAKADGWARVMAAEGRIWHSRVAENIVADWKKLGENVGTGSLVASIHDAFVDSPPHYKNLVERDFTQVGVGVALKGTVLYVAEVFMQVRAAAPPPSPSPPVPPPPPPAAKPIPPPSPPASPRPTAIPARPPASRTTRTDPPAPSVENPARTPSPLLRSVLERLQHLDP
jgi:uncharacterized protein YkwD